MDEDWDHIRQTTRPLGQSSSHPLRHGLGFDKDPVVLENLPRIFSRRRLHRGQYEPEAVLDLHGLTVIQAHDRLRIFLEKARGSHKRLVLVITGKGKNSPAEGRTLKKSFEEWMALPYFRDVVGSFSPASRRHGEAGAYYLILRG